ncbi:unnamed protein product [marine sediment metagenome]|uniref:Uncharacterized protein n=1 Tax=marine sediment metagenome TaxID=412755 RepID=X1JBS3_9ZZZZ
MPSNVSARLSPEQLAALKAKLKATGMSVSDFLKLTVGDVVGDAGAVSPPAVPAPATPAQPYVPPRPNPRPEKKTASWQGTPMTPTEAHKKYQETGILPDATLATVIDNRVPARGFVPSEPKAEKKVLTKIGNPERWECPCGYTAPERFLKCPSCEQSPNWPVGSEGSGYLCPACNRDLGGPVSVCKFCNQKIERWE